MKIIIEDGCNRMISQKKKQVDIRSLRDERYV